MGSWASERTVLVAGVLVSFLFVLTTHQAQRARRGAKRIESVNTELRIQIAERKRAELGLRENEERFRSVFEKGPMGMAMIDRTFRFIKINHAFCQMLGYTEEELMQMSFLDFTHPEDKERGVRQAEQLFAGENSDYRLVKRYLTKSGDIVWVNLTASILRDDSGRPQWGLGIVENITDRLRAEEALRSSEARLAGILDIAAEGVVSINENQRITLFNHGAESIFGYTASEVLGLPVDVLLPQRFTGDHSRHIREFADSPDITRLMSLRRAIFGRRKDGTEFPAEGSISKLDLGGQKIFTVILRDVTERKQAEEELRRTHDGLEVRVRERTAELATTNDTLRTEIDQRRQAEESLHLLSGRLLNLQDEERRRIARELHDSTAQSVAAISVNLAMVQQAASTLDPHAVNALRESETLAEECLREIRNLSYLLHPPALDDLGLVPALNSFTGGFAQRSGIHVDLEVAPDFGRLPTEVETVLFRIVQESLTNAYRYSQSQTAQIHLERSQAEVTLEVRDQGIGIPPENLDPSSGGIGRLGVGIAGMRARMRQLGGRLEIISNNLGTSVRASLPVTRCN
jgi:PAS domain S-box-containing protein